jgi:flagellar hook assembly protein FlgD
VTLHFPSPWPGTALIQLFDVRGRLIREWGDLDVSRGVHPLAWDGRVASGERASAGVYFWDIRVTGSEGTIRTRAKSVLLSR